MNELLQNPAVQTALVTLIVIVLNALVAFIKQKFPTQTALVEKNWCYLQPVVTAAIAEAKKTLAASAGTSDGIAGGAVGEILAKSLAEFTSNYKTLEGKDASVAELTAAKNEIAAQVYKAMGL